MWCFQCHGHNSPFISLGFPSPFCMHVLQSLSIACTPPVVEFLLMLLGFTRHFMFNPTPPPLWSSCVCFSVSLTSCSLASSTMSRFQFSRGTSTPPPRAIHACLPPPGPRLTASRLTRLFNIFPCEYMSHHIFISLHLSFLSAPRVVSDVEVRGGGTC
jgi:hypothetical protein